MAQRASPDFLPQVERLLSSNHPDVRQAGRVLQQVYQAMLATERRLGVVETALSVAAASGSSVVSKPFQVSADFTIPYPEESPGTVFIYTFQMDATGGWVVTPNDQMSELYADAISSGANERSTLIMLKQPDGKVVPLTPAVAELID